jgi:L,D-transpeptidase catalytic domain
MQRHASAPGSPIALRKRLQLPAALLVLTAAGLYANASQIPVAEAASRTKAAASPAHEVSAAHATPAVMSEAASPKAVPAVLSQGADGLSPKVLAMALDAVSCARARGVSGKSDLLTVIDYSLPSTEPRLWVLDLESGKVLFYELVAHGSGSGDKVPTRFSNVNDSRTTSLGLFLTGDTYEGGNGYSLKLKGLDEGVNDRAEERHIVMHGAWYVSADHARQYGMLGRSWGCPALPAAEAKPVIDTIKGGSFVFSYSGVDTVWRKASSSSLHSCAASGTQTAALKSAG